jgi:hypothetical protein
MDFNKSHLDLLLAIEPLLHNNQERKLICLQ